MTGVDQLTRALACCWVALALLFHSHPVRATGASCARPLCLQGTYIQLAAENVGWDKATWQALFDNLRQLQIRTVVIQWSVHDQEAYYRSASLTAVEQAPLDTILDLADAAGMRAMVGLSHDSAYWKHIEKRNKRAYLNKRLRKNLRVAAELMPMVASHPSFAGWYITEEIDDINWRKPADKAALFSYLRQLSDFLRSHQPQVKIGISGFANRETDPATIDLFWRELLLGATAITTVYFQDGIGVAKLTLERLPEYLHAIKNAVDFTNRELIPVIEAFEQTEGIPMSDADFSAVPATPDRLRRQLDIAARYADQWIVFAIPDYMTPHGGPRAQQLFAEALEELKSSNVDCREKPGGTP